MIPLAQTVDVSPDAVGPWLETVAWVIFGLILAVTVVSLIMMRSEVYDRDQKRQLSSIRSSKIKAKRHRIPVRRGFDTDLVRRELRSVWSAGPAELDVLSIRDSIKRARSDIASALPTLPPMIRRGVIEGAAITLLAIVIYLPIDIVTSPTAVIGRVRSLISRPETGVSVPISRLQEVLPAEIADILLSAGDLSIAIAMTALLLVWDWWFLVGLLLIASSIGILEHRARGGETSRLVTSSYVLLVVIGAIVLVGRTIDTLIDATSRGELLELAASIAIVVLLLTISILWILSRTRSEALTELSRAIETATRSITLRLVLVSRALPYATVGVVTIVLLAWIPSPDETISWSMGRYLGIVISIAIGSGLLVRFAIWFWSQIRYRAVDRRDLGESGVPEVHLRPYTLEDRDGLEIYACDVDGRTLANRDVDDLLDDVTDAVASMHDRGHRRELTYSDYYGELIDRGIVDDESVRKSLRGEIKADIRSSIARSGGRPPRVDAELLKDKMRSRYPNDAFEEVLSELYRRGEVYRFDDELVYYPSAAKN